MTFCTDFLVSLSDISGPTCRPEAVGLAVRRKILLTVYVGAVGDSVAIPAKSAPGPGVLLPPALAPILVVPGALLPAIEPGGLVLPAIVSGAP